MLFTASLMRSNLGESGAGIQIVATLSELQKANQLAIELPDGARVRAEISFMDDQRLELMIGENKIVLRPWRLGDDPLPIINMPTSSWTIL